MCSCHGGLACYRSTDTIIYHAPARACADDIISVSRLIQSPRGGATVATPRRLANASITIDPRLLVCSLLRVVAADWMQHPCDIVRMSPHVRPHPSPDHPPAILIPPSLASADVRNRKSLIRRLSAILALSYFCSCHISEVIFVDFIAVSS